MYEMKYEYVNEIVRNQYLQHDMTLSNFISRQKAQTENLLPPQHFVIVDLLLFLEANIPR